jgi:hypothetical protein
MILTVLEPESIFIRNIADLFVNGADNLGELFGLGTT